MPSISDIRIRPGSGTLTLSTSGSTSGANTGAPTPSLVSFSVQTPSAGIALFDSSSVTGNNIVLALRNIVAGSGITVAAANGQIIISNTLTAIPNILDGTTVQIGKNATAGGYSGIAIGYSATGTGGTAATGVGSNARATGDCASAFGYQTEANGFRSTAVGSFITAPSPQAVGIGYNIFASGANSIAIGSYSFTLENASEAIAIGYNAGVYTNDAIAIGAHARSGAFSQKTISIGYQATVGTYSNAAIAIGAGSTLSSNSNSSIAIGYYARGEGNAAVSMGKYSYATGNSLAIGPQCYANQSAASAIGVSATSQAHAAVALGAYSVARQPFSVVLGTNSSDLVQGSFVTSGAPVMSFLRPADHQIKLVGQTSADVSANSAWGDGNYVAKVVYDTPGTAGNAFVLHTVVSGANTPLSVEFDGTNLVINLATDGSGIATTDNTLAAIAALFPANGFSFTFTSGYDATVFTLELTGDFSGGIDGTHDCVLTADGGGAAGNNIPQIWDGTAATMTCRVVGIGTGMFDTEAGDEAAGFVMNPTFILNKSGGYSFINDPVFTIENNTDGAAEWPVPVLSIVDGDQLQLAVTNNITPIVGWMAHIGLQTTG